MKSLVPWVCFLAASASQQVVANNAFDAYRLGHYDKAVEPLIVKAGKDAVADYYLGRLYLYGYGQLKNNQLAMRYFINAAQKGYLPAVQFMAKYSLLHDKNPEQAIPWFKKAASEGDVNAQMFLAASYLYGLGVKKNLDAASHYFIEAAKNGNAIAQFALAEQFLDSRHSSNNKLGLIWLNKSAANNNPKALTKLAMLYMTGKGVAKDEAKGSDLLHQAAAQNYLPAYVQLAHAYLQEKTPTYDAKTGFSWMLKAAEKGSVAAQSELANLYRKGIGTQADAALANQWQEKAAQGQKEAAELSPLAQTALWLSNGATDKLEGTPYQMGGIFSQWSNTAVLRNNAYNQAPQMETMARQSIFKPQFQLTQPNEIPINVYYDALIKKIAPMQSNQWTYPNYRLNPHIEALEKIYSTVLDRAKMPVPYLEANYPADNDIPQASIMDIWTADWQKKVNYSAVFNQMYNKAILGDAQSQFEIGQMFQYGIGVDKNNDAAIVFYQNAADQQHLGAEYNLGMMYLEHARDAHDHQTALNWLTDSAFKGNRKAQFALSRLLDEGKKGEEGTQYIQPNREQAMSMLYLSAANNYGPAQYALAEHLARESASGLSVDVKGHKIALIRKLYAGAAKSGVAQALIPLAYYNAMDNDPSKQKEAVAAAEQQADTNEHAALLLGMLYDRGVGIGRDPAKALFWYQKSGQNPVNQFILGTYFFEGQGVVADKDKGITLLNQSASGEFPYADFNLAVLKQQSGQEFLAQLIKAYRLGDSNAGIVLADYYLAAGHDPEKINQARAIYVGLAEKGDQYAQLKLAYMIDKGLGGNVDPAVAERWYQASAEQGDATAQYLLGQFYQLGALGQPDYNLAKQWYQKAASKLSEASVALGFLYETVDDNYADAFKAYQHAAQKDSALGNYNLALMYEYGKGIPVDYKKAKQLFIAAADKGNSGAMNQLGGMYFYGLGEPRNELEALAWYKKAAALHNSNALYALGLLSETGVATKLDFPDAIKYYQQASAQGNEKAMLALARMYHYGLGVAKDTKMSATIYQKLAERQNAYAQYRLGTYYLEGIAGEVLPDKGRALLKQASDNGSTQARKILQQLDAQAQQKVSFVEPVQVNKAPVLEGKAAGLVYFDALNEWNHGEELLSRMILQRLVTQYPNFVPAKKAYEQLNQTRVGSSYS